MGEAEPDKPSSMHVSAIPLGTVIAERSFTLLDGEEQAREITVRLGAPVATTNKGDLGELAAPGTEHQHFRCPLQITGLDYGEKVFAPFGEDPFVALQYAIDLIGGLIENGMNRLKLRNPYPPIPSQPDAWIWRFDRLPKRQS